MVKPLAKLILTLTPKRRWEQFSLLTLLVVVAVSCVGLSLVVVPAERQRRAVVAIKALGGSVVYVKPDKKTTEVFPRPFLRRWLPRDYFDEVGEVYLAGAQVTKAGLAHVQGLTGLRVLHLAGTQVTDAGLSHLQGMTKLQRLHLMGTQVTDAVLAHLHGLTALDTLSLSGTQVTDAWLVHLQGLTGLQELYLDGTQFNLASIFLATSAIAAALGVFKWLGLGGLHPGRPARSSRRHSGHKQGNRLARCGHLGNASGISNVGCDPLPS